MNRVTDGRVHGRPALFLDRDGVINEDVGYAHQRKEIRFLPGIFELVAAANAADMPVVVVTNQAGIARGLYEEKDFHALMDWMKQRFREKGARLDAVYFCPHHPVHGKGHYKSTCTCRKPAPGMLLQAACELGINLKASIMLGDTAHDMEAAIAADVGTPILLELPGTGRKDTANHLPAQVRRIASLADTLKFFPLRCRDQVGRPLVSTITGERQLHKSGTAAKPMLILMGTRPEVIKMAPIVLQLRKSPNLVPIICSTGQHRELMRSALADFDLTPDVELAVMTPGQTLNSLTGRLFLGMDQTLRDIAPACILVQGDTATALVGAMSGFFQSIPVGHVEAGLRSGDLAAPYPEEFNRRAVALAASWHFAPTRRAVENLLHEGVPCKRVVLTGNTIVDALLHMRPILNLPSSKLPERVEELIRRSEPYVLITGHRRENFGQGMRSVCSALAALAERHPRCFFVYPLHPNPQARSVAEASLSELPNVLLMPPCGYKDFLRLMVHCLFMVSDSGGVQEEAPALGKRVLVTRTVTERPESVEAGFCRLVGTDATAIINAAEVLFATPAPVGAESPYGDGHAAEKIVSYLEESLI